MNLPSIRDNPIFYLGLLVTIEEGISGGTIKLAHAIPDSWIPAVDAWASILAFCGTAIMTGLAAPMGKPPTQMVAKVLAWLILPLALVLLMGGPAGAQGQPKRAPAQTDRMGGPVGQVLDKLQDPFRPEQPVTNKACDFSFFGALIAKNLLDQLRVCANTKFAKDISAALDSAKAANDTPAIACLEPGLAIVQAAIGTEVPPPADAPAGTNPTIEAPGLILIFQKFREFGVKNGVASCKSWVNATIALTNPVGQ